MKIVDDTVTLSKVVDQQTTDAVDVSEILRSSLVMAVSALDKYVHDVVRQRMVECWIGQRPRAAALGRVQIPLNRVDEAIANPRSIAWLEEEITSQHELLAFQKPDKIADAVRMITDEPLWPGVAALLELDVQDVKRRLILLVDRRNKIVHEFDIDPSTPGARWPIDYTMVEGALDLVARCVDAIHQVVEQ